MKHLPALVDTDAVLRRRCRSILAHHRQRAKADGQALDCDLAALVQCVSEAPLCSYCAARLDVGTFVIDHAIPPSRFVAPSTDALANLRVCCAPCNEAKGQLTETEYRGLLQLLRTWAPRAGHDVLTRLRHGGRRYAAGRGRA